VFYLAIRGRKKGVGLMNYGKKMAFHPIRGQALQTGNFLGYSDSKWKVALNQTGSAPGM